MDNSVNNCLEERLQQLSKLVLNTPLSSENTSKLDFLNLLDAFLVLYDECERTERRHEKHITNFLNSYATLVSDLRGLPVSAADFQEVQKFGSGRFGDVSVVKEIGTERHYALKVMRKNDALQQPDIMCFREERDIMVQSSSPWLSSLYYAFQDSDNLYLAMEFYQGGSLSDLIYYFNGRLKEQMAKFYLAELLLALRSLHKMGYVHRDVKPDNILLNSGGHVKLSDFGSAAKLNSDGHVMNCVSVGTAEYIAPEVINAVEGVGCSFQENHYGIECDYWSFGIVAFELVTGFTPFTGENDMQTHRKILCHYKYFMFPKDIELSVEITGLISRLVTNAAFRIGGEELLEHLFFSGIDWETQIYSHPPYIPTVINPTDTSNFHKTVSNYKPLPATNSLKKLKPFSNVPFVGFTFSRSFVGTTVSSLSDFSLQCKITEIQDGIHDLDIQSRAVEKWHLKYMSEKRELVRRLKHTQEMCALTEQLAVSFVYNARSMWEKQYQVEKDEMTTRVEQLEQEIKDKCTESAHNITNRSLKQQSRTVESEDDFMGTVCETVKVKLIEEKGTQVDTVMSELDCVKAELAKVNFEKEAKETELFHLKENVEKLKSSLVLEKDKTECLKQELELYHNRKLAFTRDEYSRLVDSIIKLQQEFENSSSGQTLTSQPQACDSKHTEMELSREDMVEAVSQIANKVRLMNKVDAVEKRSTVDVEVNTERALSLHRAVQTEEAVVDPVLLEMRSEYQRLEKEAARDRAELCSTRAGLRAEMRGLLDTSREHARAIEKLRDEEQVCAEELESFKKMFLDKNSEAHGLRKQLEGLERELQEAVGEAGVERGALVRSLGHMLRQLQADNRDLRAANQALERASADLEDQVDQYHDMVTQLQSRLLSRDPSRDS
ncbi:serine/threonine-protein kinase mrck-1-like [Bacillus rossius redtenbacheri]|uniref:serine/threonine-protein kinase mrck-1-like n=1 Tax=Bacillus rossius redtenbacheri TaxID=93214 RepID=UPI002FDD3703